MVSAVPVVSVVPVGSLEEAIAVGNSVDYGLSASIYTRDVNKAFTAMRDMDTGIFYVNAPTMKHVPGLAAFNRLMVGQDVGSAIRGAERGDIYFGSGDTAAKIAGSTQHPGHFFVLVPKAPSGATVGGLGQQKAQE